MTNYEITKAEIISLYGVIDSENFNAREACEKRIVYLKNYLRSTGRKGFVLGISGGVDSLTAGKLAQIACEQLRNENYNAHFYAVRLPAGIQHDESDALEALKFINPDKTITINIGNSSNIINNACLEALENIGASLTDKESDYHKGNIKARMRMIAQYHLAGSMELLVIGTDHFGEKIAAFWTRGGDEVSDILVLNGLNKRQVRLCAKNLGAPERLWNKSPTADLEELNPGKVDDEGFGYPYEAQNDFLEGKEIDPEIERKIIDKYEATRYRRSPSVEFSEYNK